MASGRGPPGAKPPSEGRVSAARPVYIVIFQAEYGGLVPEVGFAK